MSNRVILLLALCAVVHLCSADYLSLDGENWSAQNINKSIKINAKVPGSIYSDLKRNGVLKDYLYYGNNDINYRWVAYDNWTFEKSFHVDQTMLQKHRFSLLADGLDTISSVYINNIAVAKTDNQFRKYVIDVKTVLKAGQNDIRVAFESATNYAHKQFKWYSDNFHVGLEGCSDKPGEIPNGECYAAYIRKMQSSFSWDWGPAFPTQGIWKPIGIEAFDEAVIRDITVETKANPKNRSEWTLNMGVFADTANDKAVDVTFDVKLDEYQLITNQKKTLQPKNRSVKVNFEIPVTNIPIIPWFPNGVSQNTQKLYRLNVSLTSGTEHSTQSKRIGFRTIELVQEAVKPEGLTFYFKVNGLPFFAKGTNWIPAHVLQEEITPQYLRHLLGSAKRANMNMMRVWGGGVYESDLFYELADEMGIMIWQDLMFACSRYPADDHFIESVDSEIQTQLRRLQHHPSIAIWSGNNENELVISAFFHGDKMSTNDYYKLYVQNIKRLVLEDDANRPFITSSPSNGLESVQENYTAKNPNDNRYGDVHYYDDGANLWDWKSFPSAKFASEYGFQSYPSVEAYVRVLPKADITFPVSKSQEHRQRHPLGTYMIENQIGKYMKLPSKGGIDRFSDLVYLSQVTQAMAMKTETEFYRRNREVDPKTGNGYTMGALYWQLNDIWEAPSWASIEHGGKWKVLHSYATSFFDNQLAVPFEDRDGSFKVALVRDDYLGKINFKYTISFYKWSKAGQIIHRVDGTVTTDSFSSTVVYSKNMSDLLTETKECKQRSDCVVNVEVTNDEHKIRAENFYLLTEPKNSKLIDPKLKVFDVKKRPTLTDGRHVFDIRLSVESVAPFVVLDLALESGISGQFQENGFFVFDTQKSIAFETESDVSEQKIKDNIRYKTLTDVK